MQPALSPVYSQLVWLAVGLSNACMGILIEICWFRLREVGDGRKVARLSCIADRYVWQPGQVSGVP